MSLELFGRTWQDVVLSAGSLVFFISLIPALLGRDKPPVATGLLTGGMLTIYGLVYATLGLWLSLGGAFLVAGAWYALALQKWLAERRRKRAVLFQQITNIALEFCEPYPDY